MKSNYDRTVEMSCPVCGGKKFENSLALVTCQNCKNSFTSEQLQNANRAKIDATFESVKKEVFNDVKTDIQKILKKSFGSSFKIK